MTKTTLPARTNGPIAREPDEIIAPNAAPTEKKPGIRLKLELEVDKDVVVDALKEVPGLLAQAAPTIKEMMPAMTESAVKLVGALGPEAQKMIGAGLAGAAAQFGALITTASDTAKSAALAPVRGAGNLAKSAITAPFKIAAFAGNLMFGS
ncbi:MAG: hypothetical protein IT381_25560 [Deltaproteobacteria bacterium]|nr:hypothetical protein [Deltaproteobacteria bacterium]